jgi:hypothetical protein
MRRLLTRTALNQRRKFMTARKISLLLTVTLLVAITATVMRAQSSEGGANAERPATPPAAQGGILDVIEQTRQAQAQRLEGTWRVQLTTVNCQTGAAAPATGKSLNTFARGGVMVAAPALPGPPLLGVWKHVEGQRFTNTVEGFRLNPDGTYAGMVKIKADLKLEEGFNEFTAADVFEFFDADGNSVGKGCLTRRGRRIE